jgi:uncharacterized protein YbjQ (UPF0145 family)
MFCMLLRKYLTGARVRSVEQPNGDRLIVFRLESRNELGDSAELSLITELMGRAANVVLVGADGRILDCLRRIPLSEHGTRALLPGLRYELPPVPEGSVRFYDKMVPKVFLLKLIPGMDPGILEYIGDHYDAVVLETYGVGGLPFPKDRNFMAGMKTLVGGEIVGYTEMLVEARQIATKRMVDEAEELGADAVIGLRYGSSQVMDTAAEVLAYGTAVKVIGKK